MYIHKLQKSASGRSSVGSSSKNVVARHHKRTMGGALKPEVFEDGKVHRATETLRNLKVSKPRIPKQYINFDV